MLGIFIIIPAVLLVQLHYHIAVNTVPLSHQYIRIADFIPKISAEYYPDLNPMATNTTDYPMNGDNDDNDSPVNPMIIPGLPGQSTTNAERPGYSAVESKTSSKKFKR